jgi:5'-deoxynucleotidase YfbR-like HD superfamily hydrolase
MIQDHPNFNVKSMLCGETRRASHVYRYSSRPTLRRENVAEHSFYAAYYSLIIAKWLSSSGVKVSFDLLLERAILHDIDEALTGDFLRSVKYGDLRIKDGLDALSKKFLAKIEKDLGVSLLKSWETAKDAQLEGQILFLADLLCVVAYIWEEFHAGNRHLRQVFTEVKQYFEDMSEGRASGVSIHHSPLNKIVLQTIMILNDILAQHPPL